MSSRFAAAFAGFDEANAGDPNTVDCDGELVAKELLYARRMSAWLDKLAPDAPEPVRLAVRCQHICRWMSPRDRFPMGRSGYKRWRSGLARMHGDIAAGILEEVGYDAGTVERVRDLLLKKRLKADPDAQLVEDVACLVFLDSYFADFCLKHDEAKLISIVQKTWKKMSGSGHRVALTLDFAPAERAIIEKALA